MRTITFTTPEPLQQLALQVLLQITLLTSAVNTIQVHSLQKCCGEHEMLAEHGTTCVSANWEKNGDHQLNSTNVSAPKGHDGMSHWIPPDIQPNKTFIGSELLNAFFPLQIFLVANGSVTKEEVEQCDHGSAWLLNYGTKMKCVPRRGVRVDTSTIYCVDAIKNESMPFAIVGIPYRSRSIKKCCATLGLKVTISGKGKCWEDDDDEGFCAKNTVHHTVRFVFGDKRSQEMYKRKREEFFFSTWTTFCGDYEHMKDGTLRETYFLCAQSQVTRGIYELSRPLSFVSAVLLFIAMAAVLAGSRTRRTAHGWALACHAGCLLGFNLGQVVYYLSFDSFAIHGEARSLSKDCLIIGFTLNFFLTAAGSWLTAVCVNIFLGFRKLRMAQPNGRRNEWRKFASLSAFAWGLPTILSIASAVALKRLPLHWYPTFMETRSCSHSEFTGKEVRTKSGVIKWEHNVFKSGPAIFYYGPLGILVLTNVIFMVMTLQKVQFLRKGNSILRRKEKMLERDKPGERRNDGLPLKSGNTGIKERTRGGRRSTETGPHSGAQRVTMYVKLLLLAGVLEFGAELLFWLFSPFVDYHMMIPPSAHRLGPMKFIDYTYNMYAFRATGYVCDLFRAICVAWLAAPDGGYWIVIPRKLQLWKK